MDTNSDKLFSDELPSNQEQSSATPVDTNDSAIHADAQPIANEDVIETEASVEIISPVEDVVLQDDTSSVVEAHIHEDAPENEEALMALEEKYAAMDKAQLTDELSLVMVDENMDAIKAGGAYPALTLALTVNDANALLGHGWPSARKIEAVPVGMIPVILISEGRCVVVLIRR